MRRSASAEEDELGDAIDTETLVETTCELQRHAKRQSDEPAGADETSDTLWDLFLPAGTDIDTGDGVIVGGEVYEMVGDPWKARNPRTGAESHVEAVLRRTAGSGEAS